MRAILVGGMAFGDESKGALVDALSDKFPVDQVIRYSGGPQCAHNVITPGGFHHTFSQFGSGMLANPELKTHLSKYVLFEPLALMKEAENLSKGTPDPLSRLTVDPGCVVITPWHVRLNKLMEISRGVQNHGSCGRGIGTAREYHLKYGDSETLLAGDLHSYEQTFNKVAKIWMRLTDEIVSLLIKTEVTPESLDISEYCNAIVETSKKFVVGSFKPSELMVFEGAQGVLLDEKHGFQPHTTWTNCTFENADSILDDAGISRADRVRVGCFRNYFTRHGAGPFPTEDQIFHFPEQHNQSGKFQGRFRQGEFDFDLARKSLEIVGGVDYLGISHLDNKEGKRGRHIERELEVPIAVKSYGPTRGHRIFSIEFIEEVSPMVFSGSI